jgi:transposase
MTNILKKPELLNFTKLINGVHLNLFLNKYFNLSNKLQYLLKIIKSKISNIFNDINQKFSKSMSKISIKNINTSN